MSSSFQYYLLYKIFFYIINFERILSYSILNTEKRFINITMNDDNKAFINALLKKLVKLNYIKPNDVPNINLYMDQVTTFMDEHLSDVKRHEDDKILTKTMINNYTKNNLLPAPVKKKYSKEHIYILTFIYYFKNILFISDIQKILNPLTDKFFDTDSKPDLETIYNEIYLLEKTQIDYLSKDVIKKSEIANDSFKDVEDEDEREFLQLFSLVCLLSFDVYMKKNIIENLIDDFNAKQESKKKKAVKTEKKESKKETKKESKKESK